MGRLREHLREDLLSRAVTSRRVMSLGSIVVMALVGRAHPAPVPLEELVNSTWRVEAPGGVFGSGFLIDNQGYFVTAAHVLASSNGPDGRPAYPANITVKPGEDPNAAAVPATIRAAWCDEIDLTYRTCRKGADAVLLKTAAIDSKYKPFDLGFAATTPPIFRAVFTGYTNHQVGAAPSGEVIFKSVNLANSNDFNGAFAAGSTSFYQTAEESYEGNSGGPIAVNKAGSYEVVGIMSWRVHGIDRSVAAGPSFGVTIDTLRTVWAAVPRSDATRRLAASIETAAIPVATLANTLETSSNREIVSLIGELRSGERSGREIEPGYWVALYDQATRRELDWEKDYLEQHTSIASNISWLRESAKSKHRIGEYYRATEDNEKANAAFISALDLNKAFLKAAREKNFPWYGPAVFADTVGEITQLHAQLGDRQSVINWATLGSQSGAANSTGRLAERAYAMGDFESSANLYALAFQQAESAKKPAPKYVIQGYAKSVDLLPQVTPLPKEISQAPVRDASSQLSELNWIGPGWQDLAKEYAPGFMKY
jgi:trypsin-like peptidase